MNAQAVNIRLNLQDEEEVIEAVEEITDGFAEVFFDEDDNGYKVVFDDENDAMSFCKKIADNISSSKISEDEIRSLVDEGNTVFLDKPSIDEWKMVINSLEVIFEHHLSNEEEINFDDAYEGNFDEEFDLEVEEDEVDDLASTQKKTNFGIESQLAAAKAAIEKIASLNNRNFSEELRSDLLKYVIRNYQGNFFALNAPTIKLAGVIEERFQFLLEVFDRISYEMRKNILVVNIGLYSLEVPQDCNKKQLKDIVEGACILAKGDKIYYAGHDIDELNDKQFSAAIQESHFLKIPFLLRQVLSQKELDQALGNDDKVTSSYQNFLALDFDFSAEEDDFEDFDFADEPKRFAV
jgi:hypothetical protein